MPRNPFSPVSDNSNGTSRTKSRGFTLSRHASASRSSRAKLGFHYEDGRSYRAHSVRELSLIRKDVSSPRLNVDVINGLAIDTWRARPLSYSNRTSRGFRDGGLISAIVCTLNSILTCRRQLAICHRVQMNWSESRWLASNPQLSRLGQSRDLGSRHVKRRAKQYPFLFFENTSAPTYRIALV
jgi:hypothetical protein